ncbi:MAG: rRNA maturation RNase YbeY [Burkholderiales bacterium]|nr:rRNA maturation RNase YbeY [Burkholderiales bacterium]
MTATAPARPRLQAAVQRATRAPGQPTRVQLLRWARAALLRDCAATLRIVAEAEGRALNARYRGRDYPTNVLTFVYDSADPLEGDVVLCAPVIAAEAAAQGKAPDAHWAHMVVHGLLHLQGHDHETAREARVMEQLETRVLATLGYPDPYRLSA